MKGVNSAALWLSDHCEAVLDGKKRRATLEKMSLSSTARAVPIIFLLFLIVRVCVIIGVI